MMIGYVCWVLTVVVSGEVDAMGVSVMRIEGDCVYGIDCIRSGVH